MTRFDSSKLFKPKAFTYCLNNLNNRFSLIYLTGQLGYWELLRGNLDLGADSSNNYIQIVKIIKTE